MRKLLLLLVCAVALAGCGGLGIELPGIGSPYEGSWSGTWVETVADGTVSFTINIIGELNGTMHSHTSGEDGTITGAVLDNGETTVTVSFPSGTPSLGTGFLSMNVERTTLSGTLDFGGEDVSFALTKD